MGRLRKDFVFRNRSVQVPDDAGGRTAYPCILLHEASAAWKIKKKSDLYQIASPATIARMGKDGYVSLGIINYLCEYLNCPITSMVEYRPESEERERTANGYRRNVTELGLAEEKRSGVLTFGAQKYPIRHRVGLVHFVAGFGTLRHNNRCSHEYITKPSDHKSETSAWRQS